MTDETPSESNPPLFESYEEFIEAVRPILKRCPLEWDADHIAGWVSHCHRNWQFWDGNGLLSPGERYQYVLDYVKPHDCAELAALPYQEFLNSHYWKAIRDYVVHLRGRKCQLCASTTHLQVHHRTYEHRGWEHEHLDDLTVLCQSCHQTFHDHREVNS